MQEFKLEILFEDSDLVFINKPAGLPSQAGLHTRHPHCLALAEKLTNGPLYLHHRLDKDTSGVMVFSKSKRANPGLTDLFREHALTKTYWALTKPQSLHPKDACWTLENHLAPVRGPNKQLMRMVVVKSGGWKAITHFKTLEQTKYADWIEAKPQTGRTHQVRVHLAGQKFPIWGDPLYGGKNPDVPRLLLHAQSLEFKHPITQETLLISAPPPADIQALGRKWGLSL